MKPFQLIAAPPTPFYSNGDLNLAEIESLAEHLVQTGVTGAFVCGTTGESASLSTQERQKVATRWVEVAGDRLRVVVHVGHSAQVESAALAAHAQSIGVTAIAATAPFYFKPTNAAEVVNWLAPVAGAAPDLPFFYYHIPSFTGVTVPVAPILTLARETIPNLGGAKFTHENLSDFAACLEVDSRLEIFFGRDEILLAGLALGARGAVGSTYNFLAPVFHELVAAFERGDWEAARQKQVTARHYIAILAEFGGLRAMKAALKWQGVDCGPWRAPISNLTPEEEREFRTRWDSVVG